MMAASAKENGSHKKIIASPNSAQNASLHDPADEPSPASPTTAGCTDGDRSDVLEEARSYSSNKLQRTLSSAGKQLAESSTLVGPRAAEKSSSEHPSELSVSNSSSFSEESISELIEDEARIAICQLQDLEVAIKVRKGSKVDGRKTRWAVHDKVGPRNRRRKYLANKRKSESAIAPVITSEKSPSNKDTEQSQQVEAPKNQCSNKSKFHVKQLKSFSRKKSKSEQLVGASSPSLDETADDSFPINNNSSVASNYNNGDASAEIMKVEGVLGPIKTNNVLETMKIHFLEGTCNISESIPDATLSESSASTPKDKKKKKLKPGDKVITQNDENVKRRPGRPKKIKKNIFTSTPKPAEAASVDTDSSVQNNDPDNGPFSPINAEAVTPKKETNTMLSLSPDLYLRKNPVTRGLREVRKSESGSESNSSTPVKDASFHLQLSPASPPLALTPNTLSPYKYENTNGNSKLPLINAAAKALMDYEHQQQDTDKKKRRFVKKMSRTQNLLNSKETPPNAQSEGDDCPPNQVGPTTITKVGRGRKKNSLSNAWPKKTSMVVADVHNSMNGEPQAVINSPTVGRKKKGWQSNLKKNSENTVAAGGTLRKSLNNTKDEELVSNKENSITPTVPSIKSPQSLQKSNSVSAISAYDVNTPKIVSAKSANPIANSNHVAVETKVCSQTNDTSTNLELTAAEKIAVDRLTESYNLPEVKPTSEASPKNISIENKSKPIQNSNTNHAAEKKQKSILDYTTNIFAKGKLTFNTFTKSLKLSPTGKSTADVSQNGSQLSDTSSANVPLPNGNGTLEEGPASGGQSTQDPLASPRKPLSSFSPDKQKKDKAPKNKSLHAVIEKLHKPTKADELSEEEQVDHSLADRSTTKDDKIALPTDESTREDDNSTNVDNAKGKKRPRFLMELFKDEGVQLMLGSMPGVTDGAGSLDSTSHLLRPKKINDNACSESPEPGEPSQKRKKRHTEVDNLFVDEGALNLLTSIESMNRRPSLTDEPTETVKIAGGKPVKAPVSKVLEGKKRKLSGNSNASGGSLGKPVLPDSKKVKLSLNILKPSAPTGEVVKKKLGRPSNAELLKKKLQATMNGQLNAQKVLLPKPATDGKSVPPIKIRLTPSEAVGARPTTSPSISQTPKSVISPVNGKPVAFHQGISSKPTTYDVAGRKPISNNGQTLVHGVPIKKLLPAGTPKTIKIGLIKPLNRPAEKLHSKVEITRQSQRASVRNETGSHFRDIHLRKFNHFMHIIFNPTTTKMKNAFNSRVLRELCEALKYIRKEETVNLVLLTGTGSTFCQGIDLTSLQHSNIEIRKKNALNLTKVIQEFIHLLITFPKVIVAGINGTAAGLGVTMLPLFDLVIASDKADFSLPYGELGQVPEGGATYTFPQYYGKLQANNLFLGKKLTASQALSMGMVSETIWPATFIQELIPKVANIANHPSPGMVATKALVNHHLITKVELSVETECRALLQQWIAPTFSAHCKRYLDSRHILYQVPAGSGNKNNE